MQEFKDPPKFKKSKGLSRSEQWAIGIGTATCIGVLLFLFAAGKFSAEPAPTPKPTPITITVGSGGKLLAFHSFQPAYQRVLGLVGQAGYHQVDDETYAQVEAIIIQAAQQRNTPTAVAAPTRVIKGVSLGDVHVWRLCTSRRQGKLEPAQVGLVRSLDISKLVEPRARQVAEFIKVGAERPGDMLIAEAIITTCELWLDEEGQKLLER